MFSVGLTLLSGGIGRGGLCPEGQGCRGTRHLPLNFAVNLKFLKNSPFKKKIYIYIYIYTYTHTVPEGQRGWAM